MSANVDTQRPSQLLAAQRRLMAAAAWKAQVESRPDMYADHIRAFWANAVEAAEKALADLERETGERT